jgi:hypothetical protein
MGQFWRGCSLGASGRWVVNHGKVSVAFLESLPSAAPYKPLYSYPPIAF